MIEIEIKAHIKDFQEAKENLLSIGAKFINTEKQIDKVFGHPLFLDKNKMVVEGGFSARVRRKDNKIQVDFKEIKRDGIGMEFSAPASSVEIGKEFLKRLGFDEAFTVAKTRDNYEYKNFTISFDDVESLGKFVEVEHDLHEKEGSEYARKECEDLLKEISPDAILENKKYGDLMQELINKNGS